MTAHVEPFVNPQRRAARVADDPNLRVGVQGGKARGIDVILVGTFAVDDVDVVCVHALDDEDGARACAAAYRRGDDPR